MEKETTGERTYGYGALWRKHGKEEMLRRTRKANKKEQIQEIKRQWKNLGVMNEIAAFSLAFKLTGMEFKLTRAKIELLLYCEIIEEKYEYVSSNKFRSLVGFRQSRGILSLVEDYYLQSTGNRSRPHKLTPVGNQVCAAFRKHYRSLTEDVKRRYHLRSIEGRFQC